MGAKAGVVGAVAVAGLAAVVMLGAITSSVTGMFGIPGGVAGSNDCNESGGTSPEIITADGQIAHPLKGKGHTSSPFGWRGSTMHQGQDIAAPTGTPMYAALSGKVSKSGPASGFGHWIVIDGVLNGKPTSTVYGHMTSDQLKVKVGDTVKAGQQIAAVGSDGQSSGPHLHFEIWPGGRFGGSPIDPMPFLAGAATGDSAPQTGSPTTPPPATAAPNPGLAGGAVTEQVLSPNGPVGAQSSLVVKPNTYEARNSATIIRVGQQMKVPPRGWAIAIATAIVETHLSNEASPAVPESLTYPHDKASADHDSVGLFQQRPSTGWGPVKELMKPEVSTRKFYEKLLKLSGWQTMPLGVAAQKVQISAFPDRYQRWEKTAVQIILQLLKDPSLAAGGAVTGECSADGSDTPGGAIAPNNVAEVVIAAAMSQIGLPYSFGGGNAQGPTYGDGTDGVVGWDCSGLTLYAYAKVGVQLEHGATAQYRAGVKVPKGQEQRGDLVFFGSADFKHHVGIYLGNGKMLDAPESGRNVQIEKFDPRTVSDYVGAARYPSKV